MSFINDDFMLSNDTARELYHGTAGKLPIIDYHCHLSPQQIAQNVRFRDITQLWLVDSGAGDHYKWRAMRGNGVAEEYITGGSHSSWEIFEKWAETVPYLMRNPLYHWTHLELKRVFGIDRILNPGTAREIFEECNARLAEDTFRGQSLIRKFNVEVICTTDDPADDLRWHKMIAENPFGTKVLPAWRPDKAMAIENPGPYALYLEKLGAAAGMEIRSYTDLQDALQRRHDYFAAAGCSLSDHGMETFYAAGYKQSEIDAIFRKALSGGQPTLSEIEKFRSAFLFDQAVMDAQAGWAQQYHIGPLRNNNTRMFDIAGPDIGFDAIHDREMAASGHRFFDRLDSAGKLARTVLYCLNPKDNEVMTAMAGTFNDGTVPGKMQFGSGWWFLDHEYGMRRQMEVLSSLGLLSRFVGMLTDSRSFISYPRHEYFRRILCDLLGADVEQGKLPISEIERIRGMVADISYNNAKNYFRF
ncbi:MAG: glucuronate isomerase [Bacteroidales bacterium]|nr:glucuronate isomerase [Bacteroidales bacterium]